MRRAESGRHAKATETTCVVTNELATLAFVQNWGTSFLIGLALIQDMINDHEQIMGDCDQSSLSALCCKPPELPLKVAALL